MSATRTAAPASNYACDTLLSKSNDSTTGIPSVTNSTGGNKSSAYIVNAGSDNLPVVQGLVTFNGAPYVPAGLIQSAALTITGLSDNTDAALRPLFPANANGTYLISFQCSSPGIAFSVTAVGRIVSSGGVITELQGFTGVGTGAAAIIGSSPSQRLACVVINCDGSGAIQLGNQTGGSISGVAKLFKIASSN